MGVLDEMETIIGRQPQAMQDLAWAVRGQVLAIRPDLEESASVKLGVIYFKHHGVVCALSPHKAHVNLHFYKGVQLADPDGLLQGSGKALRHLKYRRLEDLDAAVLESFVQAAYALNASA
jgi:hypothetical protein